jgi:hypothetical protein
MSSIQRQLASAGALLGGVLTALAIAACAGSSAAHTTQTASIANAPASLASFSHVAQIDQLFITRVNRVCTLANADTQAAHGTFPFDDFDPLHPDSATLPKVGAFFARSQSITDRVPGQLERLGKPLAGTKTWRYLLWLAKRSRRIEDRQIKAALAGDIPGFVATVRQQQANSTSIKNLALMAGFRKSSPCGAYY